MRLRRARIFLRNSFLFSLLVLAQSRGGAQAMAAQGLQIVLTGPGSETVLSQIAPEAERSSSRGKVLSNVLEEAMASLSPEARSQIDLVILKGQGGRQAWVPRAFVTKVQMRLLVESRLGSRLFKTVMPASVRTQEELPWGTYEVPALSRIELTSYQAQWGTHLLKRRTDPAALRGEKLFVQNCMSCHASGVTQWKTVGSRFSETLPRALSAHPMRDGLKKLDERNSRALISYWNAWLTEQQNR